MQLQKLEKSNDGRFVQTVAFFMISKKSNKIKKEQDAIHGAFVCKNKKWRIKIVYCEKI